MKYRSILVAAALAVSPVVTSADTIDFTDGDTYVGANATSITGITSFGVNYTVTGKPTGQLRFSEPYSGTGGETNGLAEERDGLGIRDDEISNAPGASVPPAPRKQAVTVAFDRAVRVNGLHFLDLFLSPNVTTPRLDTERMQVWINRGALFDDFASNGDRRVFAIAPADDGVGYRFDDLIADISPAGANIGLGIEAFRNVRTLSFTASRGNDAVGVANGALAAIDVAPVPLPASILFLLGGLGGLAVLRRRKTA